jgi:hypothetical protein
MDKAGWITNTGQIKSIGTGNHNEVISKLIYSNRAIEEKWCKWHGDRPLDESDETLFGINVLGWVRYAETSYMGGHILIHCSDSVSATQKNVISRMIKASRVNTIVYVYGRQEQEAEATFNIDKSTKDADKAKAIEFLKSL